jgi:zinc-binding alcohol dehydrogenase/oxidoreductase
MKAAVLEGIGRPLKILEVAKPSPGPDEVVVKIAAASLNHRDVWIQKGLYAGLVFPIILGSDGVGTVTEVGSGGSGGWIGKLVLINPALHWGSSELNQDPRTFQILGLPSNGTFAESVVVPSSSLVEAPGSMSIQEAAAIPLAGLTAYRACVTRGNVMAGQKVLVTGIGGGVATFAAQIANSMGASVYVTSGSDEKIENSRSIGVQGGANYRNQGWKERLQEICGGFDLIIDSTGGASFNELIDLANFGAKIVFYGATLGNVPNFESRKVFWKQLSVLGTTMGSPKDFSEMVQVFDRFGIKPVIDSRFPLDRIDHGLAHMERGAQMGKIVIDVE